MILRPSSELPKRKARGGGVENRKGIPLRCRQEMAPPGPSAAKAPPPTLPGPEVSGVEGMRGRPLADHTVGNGDPGIADQLASGQQCGGVLGTPCWGGQCLPVCACAGILERQESRLAKGNVEGAETGIGPRRHAQRAPWHPHRVAPG